MSPKTRRLAKRNLDAERRQRLQAALLGGSVGRWEGVVVVDPERPRHPWAARAYDLARAS